MRTLHWIQRLSVRLALLLVTCTAIGLLGPPAEAASGGPDAFGYTWKDSAEPGGPTYDLFDISGTGTLVALGDETSSVTSVAMAPVTLGAPFNFYGVNYAQLVPCVNGYISTNLTEIGDDTYSDCPLPAVPTAGSGGRIYAYHDNLITDEGPTPPGSPLGGVWYEFFAACPVTHPGGSAMNCSIFLWRVEHSVTAVNPFDIEAVLYANGDIAYHFGPNNFERGLTSTTGILDPSFTIGLNMPCQGFGTIPPMTAVLFENPAMPPTCGITAPASMASVAGDVTITFDADDPGSGLPLTSTLEWSTDAGATWNLATAAGSSPTMNPDVMRATPFASIDFVWDSSADGVGLGGAQLADFHVTVDNGVSTSVCAVGMLSVDNRPTCAITSPAPGAAAAGLVTIVLDAMDPSNDAVTSTFEYSLDAGATWMPATAGGATPNPDVGRPTPFAGLAFDWNSAADGVGLGGAESVEFRVLLTDATAASSLCTVGMLSVDNQPSCSVTAPAMGAMVSGDVTVTFSATDPSGDALSSTFEYTSDGGVTWLPATAAGASPLANPDPPRASPFGPIDFLWDTAADGLTGPQMADLRITVDDGSTTNVCGVTGLSVGNPPGCTVSAPAAGAMVSGDVTITFGGSDPLGLPLTSTFDWSTDGGVTWLLATASGASPLANPDVGRPSPFAGVDFVWSSAADGVGLSGPQVVELRVTVDDGAITKSSCIAAGLAIDNQPECAITAPAPTASVAGEVAVTFDGTDPSNDALTSTLEFSTDGGATWQPATAAGTSPTPNPDVGRPTPFVGLSFEWDSQADMVGLAGTQVADFRVTVDDGLATSNCSVSMLQVDNQPSCTITAPTMGATATGDVTVTFSAADPSNDVTTSTLEYSLDGGVTWLLATASGASAVANPDPARATPFGPIDFLWDTAADGISGPQMADIRITVDDGSTTSTCSVTGIDISNPPSCAITAPAAAAMVSGDVTVTFDGADPVGLPLTSTFEYSTDAGATWLLATASGASPLANPDAGRAVPFVGASFTWSSPTDGVGLTGPQLVDIRVTVDDGALTSTCAVTGLTVGNQPGCAITAPAPAAVVSGDVTVTFDGTDPSNDSLTSTLEFSTDGGATWQLATAAGTSPIPNPDVGRGTPFAGITFEWDSQVDLVGLTGSQIADFRATVDDGLATSTCSVAMLQVDNQPTCSISAPAMGATVASDVTVTFSATDPSNDALTSTCEYSTDAGVTWLLATAAGASAVANPDPGRATPFGPIDFLWDTAADGIAGPQTADIRITVDDGATTGTCMVTGIDISSPPSCVITAPAPAQMLSGDVTVSFDGADPLGQPLTSTFEYSVDSGVTWLLATASVASPLANPDVGRPAPFAGAVFEWASQDDGVGVSGAQIVEFRVTVDRGGVLTSTCGVGALSLDNQPTCSITAPAGGAMAAGEVTVTFDAQDPSNDPVTSTFEFSTDGGTTWSPATAAATSPTTNPDPTRATPFVGVDFLWDSAADMIGLGGPQVVEFRITVSDGPSTPSTCLVAGLVTDNSNSCTIAAPAPAAGVAGDVMVDFGATDGSGDPLTSTFEFSTDAGATWNPATAAGAVANPDPARATPFVGVVFAWDSSLDGVGLSGVQVADLRITVDDGFVQSTCAVAGLSIDNRPACAISAPVPGAPVAGDVPLTFDVIDPSDEAVTSVFEISLDGGATWNPATAGAASPLANPDPARATPFAGVTFEWDSQADGVGLTGSEVTDLRVVTTDARGASSVCSVTGLVVSNAPTCTITAPAPGAMAAGDISVTYNVGDPSNDPVVTFFEHSTDGGATWNTATAAASSPTPSPDMLRPTPIVARVFVWDSQADGIGFPVPSNVELRITVQDATSGNSCTVAMLLVDNVPTCTVTSPAPGAMVAGNVPLVFDAMDPSNDPLTSTFEFSLDGGVTWSLATAALTSPLANPDPMRATPFVGATFEWDSQSDAVGLAGPEAALLRVTVDDGASQSTCGLMVTVDNVPACMIVSPGMGATGAGDVDITFDAVDPSSDPVTSTFEFSLDGGLTWSPATAAAASPTPNPDPLRPTPFAGQVFSWASSQDGVGITGPQNADFRITVDDGSTSSACAVTMVVVDNVPSCALVSPPGGAMVAGDVDIVFDAMDPSNDPLDSTFELSTDAGATWMPATPAAASPTANPDPARPTPFAGVIFTWDSQADSTGLTGPQMVDFRIVVDDGFASGSCSIVLTSDNQPTCTITAPMAGGSVAPDLDIVFDGMDPSNDPVTVTVEFSDDAGITWLPATASAASPTPNPEPGVATPIAGRVFTWDTVTDLALTPPGTVVMARVSLDDGTASGSCGVDVDFTCALCGDCNGDGSGPTVLDSLTGAQIAAGIFAATPTQQVCCDVDSSLTITVLDSLGMAQSAAGLPVSLTCP